MFSRKLLITKGFWYYKTLQSNITLCCVLQNVMICGLYMTEKLFTASRRCCNVAESTNQQGLAMKFTKAHEGKTIYAVPTGNNARRWGAGDQDAPTRFVVVKVKRKYVELMQERYGGTDNYCPDTGSTQSAINAGYAGNSGWRFYESLEEIEREAELRIKLKRVKSFFDRASILQEFDANVINEVYDIIEKELNK